MEGEENRDTKNDSLDYGLCIWVDGGTNHIGWTVGKDVGKDGRCSSAPHLPRAAWNLYELKNPFLAGGLMYLVIK